MSQWPEWMRPGVRVVRGPDWNVTIRDRNSLDIGTLSYVPKQAGDNKVNVVWDNGLERSYRSGYTGHYDLRAYDIQQVGIEHKNKKCSGCKDKPILGIRYNSGSVDLCTKCYMNDKHDLTQTFVRYDTEKSTGATLPPRQGAEKYKLFGVFEDSEVIRGPHWHYTSKDGGDNNKGKVMSFIALKNNVAHGWVRVKWDITKNVGEYRLGAEGSVEVVASKMVNGGTVYADHLPVVGIIKLKNGDKVQVNLSLKEFEKVQRDGNVPGGWKAEMKQCTKETGTVMELIRDGKFYRVQYQNSNCHIVVRPALYRLNGFSVGGVVRVIDSDKALRDLQDGHGGYNAQVGKAKGKLGRVVKVCQDGDMKILIDSKSKNTVLLSPACCDPVSDPKETRKAPAMPDSDDEEDDDVYLDDTDAGDASGGAVGGGDMIDDGRKYAVDRKIHDNPSEEEINKDYADMKEDITDFQDNIASVIGNMKKLDTEEEGNAMFDAFTKADLDTVQALIDSRPELIDFKMEGGRTILHMTCHEGYRDLMKYLLRQGMDLNETDDEGDTPLHYAAFGKQADCIQELLEKGALPNIQNKSGVIPLHIAVGHPCIDSVQYLILHGSDVNLKSVDGETCMHDAIIQEEAQPLICQTVLNAQNADYSVRNDRQFNVLKWAALKNNLAATKLVCENAINMVNETEPDGFSALHIACTNDRPEIASILLDQGKANPDVKDHEGRAPLHLAVYQGHKRMIDVLVDRGANINAQNKLGNTPLHVTQTKTSLSSTMRSTQLKGTRHDKNVQIIFLLVEKGASLDIKNNRGDTPLDLVKDRTIKEMIVRVTQAYKKEPAKTQGGVRLPMHWKKMDKLQLDIVPLDQSDPIQLQEFQDIAKKFSSSLSQCHIQAIKRVQNPLLWEHYSLKKREFEAKLGQGMANEQVLYHGTSWDLVEAIAEDNFDFRIAGERVGALYGNGAYFASTAKYSDLYASKNQNTGLKSMFVAKVLVGKIFQGESGIKRPPNLDPNDFRKGHYDSAVNNVASPTIYCVFDKNQYYPEYIVEYY